MGKNADWKKREKQLRKEVAAEYATRDRETQKRISTLEADAKASKEMAAKADKKSAQAEQNSALDLALSSIPWESDNSRVLARNHYAELVKRDQDTGEFMIDGVALDVFISADIPDKYPNLLASKGGVPAE